VHVSYKLMLIELYVTKLILKTLAKQKYSEEKEQFEPNVQINVVNYNQDKPVKEIQTIKDVIK
jgi:hypothetical protein